MDETAAGERRDRRRAPRVRRADRIDADWIEDEDGGDDDRNGAEAGDGSRRGRRGRRDDAGPGRRTASRLVLAAAFVLGILSLLVMLVPYDVAVAGGDPARCGPPLFELVVPPDPRFDVVEQDVCPAAARNRVVLGAVGLAAAVIVAAFTEHRTRQRTSQAHADWLAAQRRRDRRRGRGRRSGDDAPPSSPDEATAPLDGATSTPATTG